MCLPLRLFLRDLFGIRPKMFSESWATEAPTVILRPGSEAQIDPEMTRWRVYRGEYALELH
ncbi:hypothetical protein AC578_3405 [Pseudocercospora eumusae]|uniref:Uncharacterized protein n=1 Tax=Pseudocercospora eumusae TaxID=321146 RepID=A0A139H678_9PEZI|nr:hypothetical protein AC578_3405 [Pseudocercospora eumusae]